MAGIGPGITPSQQRHFLPRGDTRRLGPANTCPVQGYGANGLTHGYRGHARVRDHFPLGL